MRNEKIDMSVEQKQQISNMLQKEGLSEAEINEILNGEYASFQNATELSNWFDLEGNYQNVLRGLADGYKMDELPQIGVGRKEIQIFLEALDKCNLSVENAKAINQYSNGSNMILSMKRDMASKNDIQKGIKIDMMDKLQTRGLTQEQISGIQDLIQSMDYTSPVHQNFDKVNQYIQTVNLSKSCYPSICTAVKGMNSLEHIDSTISSLEDGLSKVQLPQSMKLYRAIKTNDTIQPNSYIGKDISNNGYTSTSPLYSSSFAKYDEYDTVMELYAPKGTQGSYITQLSDYDNVEQEVLLNANDIYVFNAQQGVMDQNGKQKTILKGLLLSKERECYRGIDKQEKVRKTQYTSRQAQETTDIETNLPVKQNRFSRFFNRVREKILKQEYNSNMERNRLSNRSKEVHDNQAFEQKVCQDKSSEENQKIQSQEEKNNTFLTDLKQQTYTSEEITQNEVKELQNQSIDPPDIEQPITDMNDMVI